ncbi:MAG: hypothetical protein IT178_10415 [Acidobacteria bacterium]|nr:hypothetical protein [Acidobacteriota bacterium]
MAAKRSSGEARPGERPKDRLGDLAEELGTFLGRTERRAAEWLDERKQVADQLTAIRDRAQHLLEQLGSMAPALRRRKKAKARKPTPGAAIPPEVKQTSKKTRTTGRPAKSSAGTVKQTEAQRRRWADYRRGDS